MPSFITPFSRRSMLRACSAAFIVAAGAGIALAQSQPPVTMAINQSPWLNSFVAMVE